MNFCQKIITMDINTYRICVYYKLQITHTHGHSEIISSHKNQFLVKLEKTSGLITFLFKCSQQYSF